MAPADADGMPAAMAPERAPGTATLRPPGAAAADGNVATLGCVTINGFGAVVVIDVIAAAVVAVVAVIVVLAIVVATESNVDLGL